MKIVLINLGKVREIIRTYEMILIEFNHDYGINRMTDDQWEKKYPGMGYVNRANGTLIQDWAMKKALMQHKDGELVGEG